MISGLFHRLLGRSFPDSSHLKGSIDSLSFSRGVVWNLASLIVLASSGLIINSLLAAYLGAAVLGVFNQVFALYLILAQFAVGGLQFSTLQKISYERDNLARSSVILFSAIILILAWGGCVAVITFFCADLVGYFLASPQVSVGVKCVAPGLLLYGLNKVLFSTVNGFMHMRAYSIFQSLRFLLIFIFISLALLLRIPSEYLPIVLTLAEALLFFVLGFYVLKFLIPPNKWSLQGFRRNLHQHLIFSLRGAASGLLTELNTKVDILMLGFFTTDKVVGLYSFAATLAEGAKQIPSVMRWNVDPILGKFFAGDSSSDIEGFSRRIQRMMFVIMTGSLILGVIGYPIFLNLLSLQEELMESFPLFVILLVGVFFGSFYTPFQGLLLQGNRPGAHSLLILTLVFFNIFLNTLLIPTFGGVGAALATACAFILEGLLIRYCARLIFGIRL